MRYMTILQCIDQFVRDVRSLDAPVVSTFLSGSMSRQEPDPQSDIDLVLLLDTNRTLSDQKSLARAVLHFTTKSQKFLDQAGLGGIKFSVPKMVRLDDWAPYMWIDAEWGLVARGGLTLDGEHLCPTLTMPRQRVLRYIAGISLASRLIICLRELAMQIKTPSGRCHLRFKYPGNVLRFAILLAKGVHVRRLDSVLAVAGALFGGAVAELAREMAEGTRHSVTLSHELAVSLGEQLISLARRLLESEEEGVIPPPGVVGDCGKDLLQQNSAVRVPGAVASFRTGLLWEIDAFCVLSGNEVGDWSALAQSLGWMAVEEREAKVFLMPAFLFTYFARHFNPVGVYNMFSQMPHHVLARDLRLDVAPYSLQLRALRTFSFFRYNALNKWIDYQLLGASMWSRQLARPRLEILRTSLKVLDELNLPTGGAIERVDALLRRLSVGEGYEQIEDEWVALADCLPPYASVLTVEMRERLDGGHHHELPG